MILTYIMINGILKAFHAAIPLYLKLNELKLAIIHIAGSDTNSKPREVFNRKTPLNSKTAIP